MTTSQTVIIVSAYLNCSPKADNAGFASQRSSELFVSYSKAIITSDRNVLRHVRDFNEPVIAINLSTEFHNDWLFSSNFRLSRRFDDGILNDIRYLFALSSLQLNRNLCSLKITF